MVKQLNSNERSQIVALLDEGISPTIARKFQVAKSTISRVKSKYKEYETFDHLGGNGRPLKLTSDVVNLIKIENLKNNKKSLRKISKSLSNTSEVNISHASVRKALNFSNLFAYSPIKKPLLTEKNKNLRYDFSKMVLKMEKRQIKKIIFSDESKFNLMYSDGKLSVWREPGKGLNPENITPTKKFGGGSVMVWGCFSYKGVGKFVFIDGIIDGDYYVSILSDNLKSSARKMKLSDFIFQQDNDPKHKCKLASEFFQEENINLLTWPAQSPDMNPIENLWGIVKTRVAELEPTNIAELKTAIMQAWKSITKKTTKSLVNSFKKRALCLFKAKGGHINY